MKGIPQSQFMVVIGWRGICTSPNSALGVFGEGNPAKISALRSSLAVESVCRRSRQDGYCRLVWHLRATFNARVDTCFMHHQYRACWDVWRIQRTMNHNMQARLFVRSVIRSFGYSFIHSCISINNTSRNIYFGSPLQNPWLFPAGRSQVSSLGAVLQLTSHRPLAKGRSAADTSTDEASAWSDGSLGSLSQNLPKTHRDSLDARTWGQAESQVRDPAPVRPQPSAMVRSAFVSCQLPYSVGALRVREPHCSEAVI
jgi:hypothetical protein